MVMKASRTLTFASLFAAAMTLASAADAQDPAAATAPMLTLAEALRLARENSPTYRQVLNDPVVDDANERAALAKYFPTPSINFSTGGGPTRSVSACPPQPLVPDPTAPICRDTRTTSTRNSSTSIGFGLDMTIFDNGTRRNTLRSTRLGADLTVIRTELEGIALRTLITQRYYATVLADRAVKLEERQVVSRTDNFTEMKDRFAIARATQIDVMVAELAVTTAQNTLERARDDARKRRLELLEAMGVQLEPNIRVDTIVPATLDPALLTTDSLLTTARKLNQVLRQNEITLRQRGIDAKFARVSRWRPTLRASADYIRDFRTSDYDAFLRPDLPYSNFSFSLSAGYDFPEWFQSSATVVSREAALTDQQLALRGQALRIERQLRSQLIDLQAAARDLALAERDARLRREVVSIADEQLAAGTLPFFQYQTYIDQAAQSERAVLLRRLGVISAQLALEETVGAPLRP
jgi:outer membrane protein TolC